MQVNAAAGIAGAIMNYSGNEALGRERRGSSPPFDSAQIGPTAAARPNDC